MIRRASPAARRRAAVLVALGLAVAVACTFLGRWQWNRHVARDALIAVVEANWRAPAVALADLVPSVDDDPATQSQWRTVTVTGQYLSDATVLLRNRPVDGVPAYHVLVPFRVVDPAGAVMVVDRGWVPIGDDASAAVTPPAPPSGDVELTARLRVPEAASDRSAPAGQVQAIDVGQVLAAGNLPGGTPAYAWYVDAASETPAPATPLGTLPPPSTDHGPHVSYAVQWWVFALAGLVAFTWLARRELLDDLASSKGGSSAGTLLTPSGPPPAATVPSRPRRRGRDEDAEDALIDAQIARPDGDQASATRSR